MDVSREDSRAYRWVCALVCKKVVVLGRVLGWMDDDARRPRPIRVWGLGHELLSSLSHAF